MLIEYRFYPKHLGKEFLEAYKQIKDERIEAKHNGNKVKNETLKLALNGLSGNLQNAHSFCYSPFAVMQINSGLPVQKYTEKNSSNYWDILYTKGQSVTKLYNYEWQIFKHIIL